MPSPAQAAIDLCGPGCLSDVAMEGDKKRKRAASVPASRPTPDFCDDLSFESAPRLAADVAPGAAQEAEDVPKTTKHAGGRPPGQERRKRLERRRDKSAHKREMRDRRANSAAQVRHVVSVALDYPRIPASSSATSAHPFSFEPRLTLTAPTLPPPALPPAPHQRCRYAKLIARMVPPGKLISTLILPSAQGLVRVADSDSAAPAPSVSAATHHPVRAPTEPQGAVSLRTCQIPASPPTST